MTSDKAADENEKLQTPLANWARMITFNRYQGRLMSKTVEENSLEEQRKHKNQGYTVIIVRWEMITF